MEGRTFTEEIVSVLSESSYQSIEDNPRIWVNDEDTPLSDLKKKLPLLAKSMADDVIPKGIFYTAENAFHRWVKGKVAKAMTSSRFHHVIHNTDRYNRVITRFTIDSFQTQNENITIRSDTADRPLAIVVTEYYIGNDTHKKPVLRHVANKIILLDEKAKELFDSEDNLHEEYLLEYRTIDDALDNEDRLMILQMHLESLDHLFDQEKCSEAIKLITSLTATTNHNNLPALHKALKHFIEAINNKSGDKTYHEFANQVKTEHFANLQRFLNDTSDLAIEQAFKLACYRLKNELKRATLSDETQDFCEPGNQILEFARTKKLNNEISKEDLPRLTKWIDGVAGIILDPSNHSDYGEHEANTAEVLTLFNKHRSLKIFAAAMLLILGLALVAASIAVAVVSFGGSAPLSAAGLGLAGALTAAGLGLLGAKIATGFIVGISITLGVGSVAAGGFFASRGVYGELGTLGNKVTAVAKDYRQKLSSASKIK